MHVSMLVASVTRTLAPKAARSLLGLARLTREVNKQGTAYQKKRGRVVGRGGSRAQPQPSFVSLSEMSIAIVFISYG